MTTASRSYLWACAASVCAAWLLASPASAQECVTAAAGAGWQTRSYPLQADIFTADFDATPSASPVNAVVGLSELAPVDFTGLATIARFNPSGQIDARNGGTYAALSPIPYAAGVPYHFRMTVDVAGKRYSLYVRPAGGSEVAVGIDYAFRSEQNGIVSLEHWGANTGGTTGAVTICNFTIAEGALDEATPAGAAVTASTHDGNLPANTVDDNLATRWSGNGDGAWIQYDLGTEQAISYVKIAVYSGNGRQNRFDLQVGDGTNWTNVLTNALTTGTTTQLVAYDFPDQTARFVRYVGHMSTVGTFNSLTEVEIWRTACPSCVTPTPTPTPTATPTPPSGFTYAWLEAESGTVTAPMQVRPADLASNSAYVEVAAGNNSTGAAPSTGHTTLTFTAATAGTYKVWGRTIAPANTDDSFWVRMDGGTWINWNDVVPSTLWQWGAVTNDAAGDAVVSFSLSAGSHTLTFAYREDGARLDRVLVTDDLAFTPSGLGQ